MRNSIGNFSNLLFLWLLSFGYLLCFQPGSAAYAQPKSPKSSGPFSADSLAKGFSLIREFNIAELGVNFSPQINFTPQFGLLNVNQALKIDSVHLEKINWCNDNIKKLENQLQFSTEIQKQNFQAQVEQLKVLLEQTKLLQTYNQKIVDREARKIEFHEQVMRKKYYDVSPEKLIVVVADFSSGDLANGREIADEIAAHLCKLVKEGVDIHVLVGEIKPGVVIRSEQLAQDVGKHFPPHTSYIVIWGTMSERTTGMFRPHITCAYKMSELNGVSVSHSIDLESLDLPFPEDPVALRKEQYGRLIGAVCAMVPKCYAAHSLNHDRVPDFQKFYKFMGNHKKEVDNINKEIASISMWAKLKPNYVHRLSAISQEHPFPRRIVNLKDNSMMVLITDEHGRHEVFNNPKDKNRKQIVYIDVAEVCDTKLHQMSEKDFWASIQSPSLNLPCVAGNGGV